MVSRYLLPLVLSLAIALELQAQIPNGTWRVFGDDGDVEHLAADGSVLWCGTNGGLVRIDTATGSVDRYTPAESGLPDLRITALARDPRGGVWIGSQSGLTRFDGATWTVHRPSESGLGGDFVQALAVDSAGGVIVNAVSGGAGTQSGGIARLGADGTWTVLGDGLPDPRATQLAVDADGTIWAGFYERRLWRFPAATRQWQRVSVPGNFLSVTALHCAPGGVLMAGTDNGHLLRISSGTVHVDTLTALERPGTIWFYKPVYAIGTDADGRVWALAYCGVVRRDDATWSAVASLDSVSLVESPQSLAFSGRSIWLGSSEGVRTRDGERWPMMATRSTGIFEYGATGLSAGTDGSVWLASRRYASRYKDGSWLSVPFDADKYALANRTATAVAPDGSMFLANKSQLMRYRNGEVRWFNGPDLGLLDREYLYGVAVEDNGDVWMGRYQGVVRLRDTVATSFLRADSLFPFTNVLAVRRDRQGRIWALGSNAAVRSDGAWTTYPIVSVNDMAEDRNGTYWFATSTGLVHLEDSAGSAKWTVYRSDNSPLPNGDVVALTLDSAGLVWAASRNAGVVVFDGAEWRAFTEANSPLSNDHVRSLATAANGDVWMGTEYGGVSVWRSTGSAAVPRSQPHAGDSLTITCRAASIEVRSPMLTPGLTVALYDIVGRRRAATSVARLGSAALPAPESGAYIVMVACDGRNVGKLVVIGDE